jgi:membrane fusion protein (multidrug efflux system)
VHWGRWVFWLAAAAATAALAYFGIPWFHFRESHSITEDAFVEAYIVNIAPQTVSGHLVRLSVQENDQVKQGQVMAEIDPVPYRAQVNIARGKVAAALAELRRKERGRQPGRLGDLRPNHWQAAPQVSRPIPPASTGEKPPPAGQPAS